MNSSILSGLIGVGIVALLSGCSEPASPEQPLARSIPPYLPGKVCVVSQKTLGEMGAPVVHIHQGERIKLCCRHCIPDFNENPEKFLAALRTPPLDDD